MTNVAVVFAGGVGMRMRTKDRPKQFLMVHGKPIIVHTIEVFQKHPGIDAIIVACVGEWIPYMQDLVDRFQLSKVVRIVQGGATGQESIFNGLVAAEQEYGADEVIVLIHDGVRPLIDEDTISANISSVEKFGSGITCVEAKETVVLVQNDTEVKTIVQRSASRIARAPQSFWLSDILAAHRQAIQDGNTEYVDSCTLMSAYGYSLVVVQGRQDNLKVTTPEDFYTFRAIADARENAQLEIQ